MKKFLLVLAAMLLFSMTARADRCPSGKYWATSVNDCVACPIYCSVCESTSSGMSCSACGSGCFLKGIYGCSPCGAGTYSKGGTATSCRTCPAGTWSEWASSSCSPCSSIAVENGTCTSCSSTGTCSAISCNSGYTLSNGKCVSGSQEDSSSTCGNGYVLIDGVCEEVCQSRVNLTGGVCMKYCAGTVGSSSQIRRMCLYARCFDGRAPKSTTATYLGENVPHRYCCPENCAD